MPLISAGTMAQLVGISESAMLDTVEIYGAGTRTVTSLPNGGWTVGNTATPPVETVGMIGPLSDAAIEQLRADRLEYAGMEQLEVPMDVDVTGADRVRVTSARHGTVTDYSVEGVAPLGTYAVSRGLIVKAVQAVP